MVVVNNVVVVDQAPPEVHDVVDYNLLLTRLLSINLLLFILVVVGICCCSC